MQESAHPKSGIVVILALFILISLSIYLWLYRSSIFDSSQVTSGSAGPDENSSLDVAESSIAESSSSAQRSGNTNIDVRSLDNGNTNAQFSVSMNVLLEIGFRISVEQMAILIKINAFRFTQNNKRELLWEAHLKISKVTFEEHVTTLFKTEKVNYKTPQLISTSLENAFDEIELLGFPLCSPFKLLDESTKNQIKAKELPFYKRKIVSIEGYLITTKNTATKNQRMMHFGTFLDREGDFIDTVHFPPIAAKFPFRGKGIYKITGKVLEEFDCITIEVISMYRQAVIEDPRYSDNTKPVAI